MSAGSNFVGGEDSLPADADMDEHTGVLPPALADYDAAEYARRVRIAEGKLPRSGDLS